MENPRPHTSGPRIVNPYVENSSSKAGRFITLSVFVHAAILATVSLMNVAPLEISKSDNIIEIEMGDNGAEALGDTDLGALGDASSSGSTGTTTPETAAAVTAPPTPATPIPETTTPTTSAPIAKVPSAPPVKANPQPIAPVIAPKSSEPQTAPAAVEPSTPPTTATATNHQTEEVPAPDLESTPTGEVPVSQLDEKDLQEDFEKIDQKNSESAASAKKALEEETAKAAAANEAALAEAKQKADAEQAEILAAAEARRQKDAEILAAAKAKEIAMIAARKARAQERAEAEERARAANAAVAAKAAADAAAIAAADSAQKGNGSGASEKEDGTSSDATGDGNGSSAGTGEGTKQVAGIPGGVRSLGQLRQKPGNRFPPYEPRERLLRQEGSVVYYAYVNKDGSLSEFKLSKSTGYKNLDDKTLAALRTWKFYPGQEGWVEMPFQWSLKGEAQEAGGLLR